MRRNSMTRPPRVWLKPYSVNGTGIRLLDYRQVSADVYEATRWVTFFFVPLIPISTWLIRPGTAEGHGTGVEYQFQIVGSRPMRVDAIVRKYAITVAALIPLVLLLWLKPEQGLPPSIQLTITLGAVAWCFGLLFFSARSGSHLYSAPATQPLPTGGHPPGRSA